MTYDRNTNVGNWRDGRENGFRGIGKERVQETAGGVAAEKEEGRRGRNKEDERSRAQV